MSTNQRRQRNFKRKFVGYILLLGILLVCLYLLNFFVIAKKPLFISPIGKTNIDLSLVEKILKKNNISFSQVSLSNYSYQVNISNNGQVRLSLDKDINQQISSLQRILNQLTIDGKTFKSIDFRFSEPVVTF